MPGPPEFASSYPHHVSCNSPLLSLSSPVRQQTLRYRPVGFPPTVSIPGLQIADLNRQTLVREYALTADSILTCVAFLFPIESSSSLNC